VVPVPIPLRCKRPAFDLVVRRFCSIREIDESLWSSLSRKHGLFCSYRFIRAVEEARIGDSRFWYLIFSAGETPVAAAVLSTFDMSLDLLAGASVQRTVQAIRNRLPAFLRIRILFCGLPISIGKHTLVIADDRWWHEVIRLLSQELAAIARSRDIHLLCVKEFAPGEASAFDDLGVSRFIRANSLPYYRLRIQWPTFRDYLASMRHPYRRRAGKSLKQLGVAEPVIETVDGVNHLPDQPGLFICNSSAFPPATFHSLYLNVMARASARLETLNRAFFTSLFDSLSRNAEVLFFAEGRQVKSAAVIATDGDVLTFLLVGLSYSDAEKAYDAYHNLLYAMVALAIRRRCAYLDLGQTASWSKQCIGGESVPLRFFLRSENRLMHRTLSVLNPLLFPLTPEPRPRVFRSRAGSSQTEERIRPAERTP
jgi:predicted N-acyltransferase